MRQTAFDSARLDRIFRARSVALIGVSANARKLNGAPLRILKTTGFPGAIYPVNPKYDEIEGIRCYARIADLPETPDVAVMVVPAREVPAALEACGRKGIRAAVVISSGFEEVAGSEALIERLKQACREHDIALVGPNCEGVWSVRSKVLLTFGSAARREHLAYRPVAILSQSGSLGGAVARHLQDSGFGCAYLVSVGNETVLGVLDYLEYLIAQDDVRVVLMFLEGLKHGERLLEIAARARSRGIVLVALKSGNSQIGREAVASHTGKIATPYAIYRDVFAQAGIVPVNGLVELIEAAEIFSTLPLPRATQGGNPGLAVFSVPGGTRALTADLCEQHGVPLAVFEPRTVATLKRHIPEYGYAQNPTDITGQLLSAPQMFNETLGVVARDPNTEALLVQLANRGPLDAADYRQTIHDAATANGVPAVISFLGDALPGGERRVFAEHGLICARDPGDAVRYFSWLYQARQMLRQPARAVPAAAAAPPPDISSDWAGCTKLLAAAGIATPRWALLQPGERAQTACRELRFPVALKALPGDADHKTERGLLRLNLATPAEVEAAAHELRGKLGRTNAALLVQEMVAGGVETVLSVMRNDDFGAVLAVGSGGVLVELARDIGYLCLPADAAEVGALFDRLKLARLLAGYRGAPRCDRAALVQAALGLARVFAPLPLQEIEINPLIVLADGHGVMAVDVLVKPLPAG